MVKKIIMFVVLCMFFVAHAEEGKDVKIETTRSHYMLNFESVYTTYVNIGIETMITLPEGYKFTASVIGQPDYISAMPIQNTMYITKVAEGKFTTNLALHVVTPEGVSEKLIFKVIGLPSKNTPRIYAIHFDAPNASKMNRTIEVLKSRYNTQLATALSEQEKDLNQSIHTEVMCKGMPWFIKRKRGKYKVENKGAWAKFWGMYNSRSETFIYIFSNQKVDECNVVQLKSIGERKSPQETEFVCSYEYRNNYMHVYKTSVIEPRFCKNGGARRIRLRLVFSIWSKKFTKKIKVS